MQIHITKVQGRSVYGHSTEHCEDGGCAGHEYYFPGLDPKDDSAVRPGSVIESGGNYYLAPADDPSNVAAAGPANEFATAQEAELAAEELAKIPGFEGKWVVRWRDA